MIDALGQVFHRGDTVILIIFQTFDVGIVMDDDNNFIYVHSRGLYSWYRSEDGVYKQMVRVDANTIDQELMEKLRSSILIRYFNEGGIQERNGEKIGADALGRDIQLGDHVAIRKGAKYVSSGSVQGKSGSFLIIDGKRKSSKFVVRV